MMFQRDPNQLNYVDLVSAYELGRSRALLAWKEEFRTQHQNNPHYAKAAIKIAEIEAQDKRLAREHSRDRAV